MPEQKDTIESIRKALTERMEYNADFNTLTALVRQKAYWLAEISKHLKAFRLCIRT